MTLQEILLGGSGLAVALLSLVQIAPIKVNPWSWIAKTVGRALNADVIRQLEKVQAAQIENREALEKHIRLDDERNANSHRAAILAFNTELLRGIDHTREDFIEALAEIDQYEAYCRAHPDYKNNRAKYAIANIGRVYNERLKKHDFLGEKYSPEA